MKKFLGIAFILFSALAKIQGQTLSVAPSTVSLTAVASATGTFNITASLTTWNITDDATWLTVSPSTGITDALITVTAEANPSALSRSAIVTVTGTGVSDQTVTVTQAGAAASLTLSTTTVSVNAAAGSIGTFGITSNTTWTVVSSQTWLTVSSGSGSNNATITVTAEVNSSLSSRTATVTVTGNGLSPQTVTVTQAGAAAYLNLSTTTVSVAAASGSTGTFNIASNTSWTISDNQTWLTLSMANGSNNGTITVTATGNSSTSVRSAIVTISGSGVSDQTVTVTQAGSAAYLNLSTTTVSVAYTAGATGTFSITSNTTWTITDNQTWLTLSTAGGSNDATITVTATANSSASTRTATVTVSGTGVSTQTVTVTQAGIPTYTIGLTVSPVSSGTTTGAGIYNEGTSVTITSTPASGYQFVNWTEGGTSVSTNASYTFTISANRTLVANFSLLTYTIATSSSPVLGGTTSGGGLYTYGATATVTATPATGYQFVNWTQAGSAVSTSVSYSFPVSANRTLVANFSLISYTISTTSSPTAGGSTSGGGTLNYGTSATVTATPATGYQFVNWTEGGSPVSISTSYTFTVNANRSLLANFSLINYTVSTSSSPSAGGTTSGAGTYSYGTSATVAASPATGYLFANWTESGTVVSTNVSYTFTVTGNRSIVANYNLITFTVTTASTPSAGGTTAGGGTFNPGTSATVTATPASGYLFVSWTEGGTAVSTNPNYTFLVYANRALVATFQSISYITINTLSSPSGGGTTSGAGTFPANSQITVHATAATGYNFINWTEGVAVVSVSEGYTFTVTSNRTLVANFSQLSYTISTSSSPSGGGSTSGGGSYNYGNEVTVNATPAAGYQFVNWTQGGSSVSTNSSYTFTVGGNRTLIANFTLISYTIGTSSSPSGGGTTGGGGTFTYNDEVTVIATPAGGYNFVNWTLGGSVVSTSSSYTFTVTSSRSFVANFSQVIYTVSTSSSPSAGGSATGGGNYSSGSSATVTANPATGYQFVNWTQGGSPVSTSASYTFTVTASRTLVANFTQASYTITTASNPSAGGATAGGGGFNHGASVTVVATPASGYQFTNWTEGGTAVSTNANYGFTVTASRSLLANFSLIPKVLNLTGSGGTVLHNNDIITIGSSDAGSFLITVDANADWTVSESSLWFKAVKESNTSLRVTYMENISVIDKTAVLKVLTTLNAEMQINVLQKARLSQLDISKSESIKLYPNPAFDHAFIYFRDELKGKLRISITSMQGNLVQSKVFTDIEADQIIEMDIAGMKTGQYLIKLRNETGQKILQMIKY